MLRYQGAIPWGQQQPLRQKPMSASARKTWSPHLRSNTALSNRASQKMLDDLIVMITRHLKKGERVKITGLGILQVSGTPLPHVRFTPKSGHMRCN